jgi:hypothetical protein
MKLDYTLARTDDSHFRWYYIVDDASQFFPSVTSVMSKTVPKSPGLINWMKNMTAEEQAQRLLETSAYGTFFHIQAKEYFDLNRSFSFADIDLKIEEYCTAEGIVLDTSGWASKVKNDIYALNEWAEERNVVPLEVEWQDETVKATEATLCYSNYEPIQSDDFWGSITQYAKRPSVAFAGAIDLVCELDFNRGRHTAIVDFKTGSIWPEYRFQLEMYKLLWNTNFSEEPVDMIFNWAPKDITNKTTCSFVNQTGKTTATEMAGIFLMASEWVQTNPRPKVIYDDIVQGKGDFQIVEPTQYYKEQA